MGGNWGRNWIQKDTIKLKHYIVKIMKWRTEMNGVCVRDQRFRTYFMNGSKILSDDKNPCHGPGDNCPKKGRN